MTYLNEILYPNENLHQSVLTFFSQFPEPLQHFVLNSSSALEILQQITMLINGMQHRNELVQRCMQRKYPPLVIELRDILCIPSDRLMNIVFNAIVRQLWGQLVPNTHPFYGLIHKVFQKDVASHKQAIASGSLSLDHNATIHSYLSLYSQLRDAGIHSQAVQVAAQPQMHHQPGPNTAYTIPYGDGSSSTGRILPFSTQQATTYQTLTQPPLMRRTPIPGDPHQLNNRVHGISPQTSTNLNWATELTRQENFPRQNVNRETPIAWTI
jgi:hypothetical protein